MFAIVKMAHVCQYWRSTLISYPHLWSSIFVRSDHRDFVAACLERGQEAPLTVHLNLEYYDDEQCPDAIHPLLEGDHARRIRTLDVHLAMSNTVEEESPDDRFRDALDAFGLL